MSSYSGTYRGPFTGSSPRYAEDHYDNYVGIGKYSDRYVQDYKFEVYGGVGIQGISDCSLSNYAITNLPSGATLNSATGVLTASGTFTSSKSMQTVI